MVTLRDRRAGFARVYNGKRSIGTVARPDFAPMWTARLSDGRFVGQAATRAGALALIARKLELLEKGESPW